jgi:Rod binding domain-containing protein
MLPPIDPAQLPPDVRKAGPEAQKLYGAALQFEGMLVQQITDQMFQSVDDGSSDDSSDSSGDGSSTSTSSTMGGDYQSMLPGTMADAITQDGGLGLADELYRSMALRYGVDTSATGTGSGTAGDGGTTGGTGSA